MVISASIAVVNGSGTKTGGAALGVCFRRVDAICDQAVDCSVKAAPKRVSDETGYGGLAVHAPDHRREANDVVELDRGVIVSIVVVEWVERARESASNAGCGDSVHPEIDWWHAVAAMLRLVVEGGWVVERRLISDVVEFGCG